MNKLKWIKKGLIYAPSADGGWRDNTALTPTAFDYDENKIRIYAGFRDGSGISRIGYVDLDKKDPSRIIGISDTPVLDVGKAGMFDDNGVILGDVIRVKEKVYMYYVGFQLVGKVKFLAFTGLAISLDGGDTFERYSQTPILDRSDEALYIRAIHSVIYQDGIFKVWYATGSGWQNIDGVNYPQYDINYLESDDGVSFLNKGVKVIENNVLNGEYRIGRPRVYMKDEEYIMNFTFGTLDGRYEAGQASSSNGIVWERDDSSIGIVVSDSGWDSKHLSYPSVIRNCDGKTYMFYNGNDMGINGFGYAELIEEGI